MDKEGEGMVDEKEGEEKEDERKERGRKGAREIKINVQKKKLHRTQSEDVWPRRKRTDITQLYH